jgi:tetratricopeptide (TPR) repeat protein
MDDERTSTDRISAAADFHELAKRILTAQGQADLAKGEGDKAEEVRQQAREAARKAHEAGKGLRDRRNYSDAIAKFDRAIALNPEHSEAFYDRGTCYLKIGNFVPGILDFSRALELNPRFADQFYNKVYQVSYVVDLNRVITELNKIVADHPDVSYVIFLRGFFYVAKTEFKKFDKSDLDSGIRDFDRTLQLNPKHVSAFIYRGFLYYKGATIAPKEEKQKLFDRAMEDYDAAITRDPESGISHFLKAMCWSVQSQEATAPEEKAKLVDTAIEELRISINEKQFKGFDRIKNDKGFEAIKNEPRVLQLMQGK